MWIYTSECLQHTETSKDERQTDTMRACRRRMRVKSLSATQFPPFLGDQLEGDPD